MMTREESLEIIRRASGGNTPAGSETSQTVQDNTQQQNTGMRSREESLRIIQSAMGGWSTQTQGAAVPPSVSSADSSPKGGASAATPQSAAPTAPLTQGSLAGDGGSAAGSGGVRGGRADTRANLQRQLNALDEAAAYVTTTEQSDAIEQQRRPIIEQLRQMDEEEGRTGVYTGGDRLKNLFSNARLATQQGLTKADHRIAQTADWLFGGIAKEGRALLNTTLQSINPNWGFENEDPLITQYNKRGEDVIAHNEAVAQKRIEEGKLSPTAWKYAPEVVAAIPDVVLAHLTAGASSGAQATSAGLEAASAAAQAGKAAQTIVPIANATKNMIKNPAWESAFAQTAGSSYEQALAEGATEEEANLYALLNGFANATIEVGGSDEALGGIQKLPQQLRDALEKGNNTAVMRWIKSTVNEAVEEVAQGSAEKALRGIYTNDVPLYSATDENAVINPTRAKEEALGGFVVGGLLGGGQSLLQAAINENRQSARSAQTTGQEQTGTETQAAEQAENSTAQTQEKSYPTVEELIQPIRPAGNADAEAFAPAAGGNAPVNAGVQATAQGQAVGQQVMTQEERAQKEADWYANREKEAEKAYEDAKKRYEEALNGGNADETDFFSGPEMRKVLMDMAKKDLEDVRNRKIPSPFSNAEAQAAGTAVAEETPQSETPQSTPGRPVMDTAENFTGIPGPAQRKGKGNNAPLQQNIDNGGTTAYNNNRITNGGAEDGIRTAGLQQDDAGRSAEANRRGIPGIYQYSNSNNSGWGRSGEVPVGTGFVLISENARKRLNERGVAVVEARDASSDKAAFSSALESARANDPDNGWAVTPKSAEELEQSGARLLMDERGSAGLAVTPDGDIEAVFANHAAGAPKGATKSLIPMAIANGGTKLDCYGIDLVKLYAQYGFTPVARVEFDPEYANPGWDSSKGTPDIYFLMHNGDSADSVVDKIGTYPIPTAEELQALPEMDYDSAYAYRDRLLAERSGKGSPQGGASAATPQSAAPATPIAEKPLRAATQGRPYSQPGQGAELNARQETQTQAAEAAQNAQRATPQAETPPKTANAAQAASDALNQQDGTNAQGQETVEEQNAAPAADNQTTGQGEQTGGANAVRGFSKNVATDSAMEMALREDIAANPDLYKRLSNKDTLKKAQEIFSQGLDTARTELERAIGAAQSGQKFPPEMVPLSRMVANELTRQGELTSARKIISDVAAELTGAGQLGQAGAILRDADPITVLNTLQNALDSINKEVSGKQGNSRKRKDAETTGAELENAVKDAAGKVAENEEIRNAVKRGIDRSRSGKGKGGEKQEPSIAEVLRDALKRDAFSRTKPKTTDPQKELVKSLKRFAMEKLPPKQGTRQKTAADVLSDYVKNQEMFTEAWEDAQQMLREDEQVKWNPVIEEILGGFVNEGINVNANYPAEIRGKIMTKALTEEAMNTGETKETIRNQYALGVSVEEIGGRIADSLIRQTGASGEIAETIRDAAAAYADRIISEDTKGAGARAEKLVNSAVVSVGETMRSLAKQGKTSKAEMKRAVADVLAFEYAVDQKTAEGIAERVYSEYDAQLKKSMDAEVQRRYGDKKQGEQTFLKNSIIEATNIGAFESEYAEKAAYQLTKKAIQDLRTTVEKIALGNRAEKASIRDAVVSLFVDNYELSVEQARDIADVVKSQFDKMVGQAADRILERRFGEKLSRIAQKTDTVQKLIEAVNIGAFNSDYAYAAANKLFGLDKIKAGNWKAELTAEEIKQISETDFSRDGAYEAIQRQIAERLGREMPATLAEKLREIRKVGMLANPKTQIKNVLGNAPLAAERKVAERLSGGIQELAVKAGIMSKEEQTRTLRVSQESKDLAKSVYKNNIGRITGKGNKGELRGILKDTRTYFNKGLLQKGIEKVTGHQLNDAALDYVRRFTYDMLEKGDAPFVKSAFIDSLAQYCEAQGIKSEADVTETAFSYALDQAMAATFKDASAFAKLLNSIKDNAGIAGQALDVLFPFTTTPINIAKEFGKYSPLGYLQLLNAKGKSAAEVIDIASRATTGSAVVALGILLRSLGAITGAADDDKDKAAHDRAKGISPYSILGKYSYEWMQPTGSALAMGASIYDAAKDGSSLIETLSNGIISAGDAYLEQSFYKDIIDLFKGYGSPTENVIRELLTGTASQFIPTIVGATARTIDPTVRTSYSGGNIIDDILAQAKVKTPGISKSAPASVNVRGEEIQRGNLAQRILDNFIFPWTTNRNGGEENAVDEAINEVYADTADKTIFRQVSPYKVDYHGETYQMTGEEREQFQKTQGQVHDDILQQIIDGEQWKDLSNGEKAKIMQRVNEYALDSAKRELVEARGNEYSSDWDDEAELTDISSYFVAKIKADKDGNGRISQEELWYYLGLQKNMPNSTKSELWDILTTGKTGYAQYAEKQK